MNKIIIIEENSYLNVLMEKLLNKNGIFNIETLKESLITESYLRYINKEVALFIIDLDNYVHNGIDLISMIHNIDKNNPIAIIALSENGNQSMLKKAVLAGCNDFVLKPFENSSLIFKVKKLLEIRQSNENSPNKYNPVEVKEDSDIQFSWNQDFEIKIEEIDNEHKSIIKKYEVLYELMKEGKGHDYYQELLSFLNNYVHTHFDHEQEMHEASNYELKEEHKMIHEEFKASVLNIFEDNKDKLVTDKDLISINLFIKNWLIHHILIEDRKFGDFIVRNK